MQNSTKNMFVSRYAAVAYTCPAISFKPHTGYLLEAVESTVDQINVDDTDVVNPIPTQDTQTVDTRVMPSAGERIIGEEEDIPDGITSGGTSVPSNENLFTMDDLLGEHEGEEKEETLNATEKYISNVHTLMFDEYNEQNASVIMDASTVVAKHLGTIYNTLTTELRPEVETLTSKIEDEAERVKDSSGTEDLARYMNIDSKVMRVVDWSKMATLGTAAHIIENARRIGGIGNTANMLSYPVSRALTRKWVPTLETADIPDTVKSNMINMVAVEIGETTDEAGITASTAPNAPVTMYDETEENEITRPIEDAEVKATEAFTAFINKKDYTAGEEGVFSDLVRKVKELFASTETNVERLKAVNIQKYNTIQKDKLSSTKTVLINKAFSQKTYAMLSGAYMDVMKLVKTCTELRADAPPAEASHIVQMTKRLEGMLPGYKQTGGFISTAIKENSSNESVKSSEWAIKDIAIVSKVYELSKNYKNISMEVYNAYDINRFKDRYTADHVFSAMICAEYFVHYTAAFLSAIVKTCLRVVYAYDHAAEGSATESYSDLKASIEAFSIDGDVAGTEGIVSRVALMLKDLFIGVSRKYDALQNINDRSIPDKTDVNGLPIKYIKKVIEFVRHTNLDLEKISEQFLAAVDSCTVAKDAERKMSSTKNVILDTFIDNYDDLFKKAAAAFEIPVGVFIGSPSKALKLKTEKCTYTKQDILYVKNNAKYLKELFDTSHALETPSIENRRTNTIFAIALIATGIGSLAGIIRLIRAAFMPSKEDADKLNKFADYMHGYIKFVYTTLNVMSTSITKEVGTECFGPFMDDMFGENEGDDKEDDKNATVVDNIAKESLSAKVYNIVATNIGYNRFIKQMHHHIASVETGKQVSALIDIVESYPKVLDSYRRMDFGISRKDNELIKKNADIVMDILYSAGLHLLTSRKYFKDNNVLVLDIDSVNSDTMDTFNKNGGTMEDITRHVFHKYSVMNVTIPTNGLRVDEIINSKSIVAKEHMRRVDMSKKDMEIKHGGALVIAYNRVLGNYLSTVPSDKLPVGMSTHNFVKQNMRHVNNTSIYLKDSRLSVDECVYRFLLDLWYNDKPAYKQMYNKFEAKYKQLFNLSDGEITAEEKVQADAEVMADMAMNFVMDSLVCKHKA